MSCDSLPVPPFHQKGLYHCEPKSTLRSFVLLFTFARNFAREARKVTDPAGDLTGDIWLVEEPALSCMPHSYLPVERNLRRSLDSMCVRPENRRCNGGQEQCLGSHHGTSVVSRAH